LTSEKSRDDGRASWESGKNELQSTKLSSTSYFACISWLTFVRNRGELAEGWYDPVTKQKANTTAQTEPPRGKKRASPSYGTTIKKNQAESESDEDDIGPRPPPKSGVGRRAGPVIPSIQDLEYRDGKL
jgi:hypothetical protein